MLSAARHTPPVSRGTSRAASEALHACLRLQRSHIDVAPALRTGTLLSFIFLLALPSGNIPIATSIAIGVLFIAILDSTEAPQIRLRSMLWGILWISLAVLLGGLVSGATIPHVILAVLVAAAVGYAGALSMRGALIGVLSLVLFALYSGFGVGVNVAIEDAGLFVVGGFITIAVNLAMTPLHRLPAVRTSIARTFREIDQATRRRGLALAAPTIAAEILEAHTVADHRGCTDDTAAWVHDLLGDAERTRLALLALLAERSVSPTYVDDVARAAGTVAAALADEVQGPLGIPSRRRRARPTTRLRALDEIVAVAPDPRLGILAEELTAGLRAATQRLDGAWPIGRRAELKPVHLPHLPVLTRLRAHAHRSNAVVEHTLRLMVAFGGATLFAVLIDQPHGYWVPLTVAWIAKPDIASTVSRVVMRIVGTIVGLIAVAAIALAVRDLPSEQILLSISLGVAGALALAFLWANYPVAVVGITAFVLLLGEFDNPELERNLISHLVATVVAGVWVILVSSIRPRRASVATLGALRASCQALREYARVVQTGQDAAAARSQVLATRTAALAAVSAAVAEPPGLWERPGPHVDPDEAAAILADAIDSASAILAEELLERHGTQDPGTWSRITGDLDDIDARITSMEMSPA